MDTHGHGAVELFSQMLHRRVGFRIDEDHALEIVAVKHWLDRDETDDDRRNGQQHQRQRDNPGGFMRFLTRCQTVMVVV